MRKSVFACLMLAGSLAAGDAADEEIAKQVTVRPGNLNLSRSVHYDENGAVNSTNTSFQLYLNLRYGSLPVVGVRDFTLDDVVTDSGEELAQTKERNHGYDSMSLMRRGGEGSTSLYCNLSWPAKPINAIKELRGTVRLAIASGKLKKVTLDRLADYEKQAVALEAFPGTGIQVQRQKNQTQVNMGQDLYSLITEMRFLDKDNAPIKADYYSSGSNGSTWYQSFRGTFPDDAKLVIYFYESKREVLVPVSLKDLAFPSPAPAGGKVVLPSQDADKGEF